VVCRGALTPRAARSAAFLVAGTTLSIALPVGARLDVLPGIDDPTWGKTSSPRHPGGGRPLDSCSQFGIEEAPGHGSDLVEIPRSRAPPGVGHLSETRLRPFLRAGSRWVADSRGHRSSPRLRGHFCAQIKGLRNPILGAPQTRIVPLNLNDSLDSPRGSIALTPIRRSESNTR